MGLPLNHAFFAGLFHEKKPSSYWGTSFIEPSFRDLTMGYFKTWPWHFLGTLYCMWCMEYPVHKKMGDMKINHTWGGPWPQTVVGDPSSLSLFFSNKGDLHLHVHLNFYISNFSEKPIIVLIGVPNHGVGSKVFRLWEIAPAIPVDPHIFKATGSPWVESSLFQRSKLLFLFAPFFSMFFFDVFPMFFLDVFPCFISIPASLDHPNSAAGRCFEKIRPCRHHPEPVAAVFPRSLDARGGPHGMAVPAICNQHVGFWWKKW